MYFPFRRLWISIAFIVGAHAAPTLNSSLALVARDSHAFTLSDLTITIYDQSDCQGSTWPMQPQYGLNNHFTVNSYQLSRGLHSEQLDFSTYNDKKTAGPGGVDPQCAVWQKTVRAADSSSGCFNVKGSSCFRLWEY